MDRIFLLIEGVDVADVSQGCIPTYVFRKSSELEDYIEPWYVEERYVCVDNEGVFYNLQVYENKIRLIRNECVAKDDFFAEIFYNYIEYLYKLGSVRINKFDLDNLKAFFDKKDYKSIVAREEFNFLWTGL